MVDRALIITVTVVVINEVDAMVILPFLSSMLLVSSLMLMCCGASCYSSAAREPADDCLLRLPHGAALRGVLGKIPAVICLVSSGTDSTLLMIGLPVPVAAPATVMLGLALLLMHREGCCSVLLVQSGLCCNTLKLVHHQGKNLISGLVFDTAFHLES